MVICSRNLSTDLIWKALSWAKYFITGPIQGNIHIYICEMYSLMFCLSQPYSRMFCYYHIPFLLDDLKRIDLTSNLISEIDEDAFRKLPRLQELVLRDNKIKQLPELPNTLTFIDISNNRLGRKGIKQEAFKVSSSHYMRMEALSFPFLLVMA